MPCRPKTIKRKVRRCYLFAILVTLLGGFTGNLTGPITDPAVLLSSGLQGINSAGCRYFSDSHNLSCSQELGRGS